MAKGVGVGETPDRSGVSPTPTANNGLNNYKYAILMYESAALPDDLKVVAGIAEYFKTLEGADKTLLQISGTLEEAATTIDNFKAQTCGSTYDLAVINLNMFGSAKELSFFLEPDISGDPRTIFLATLRFMMGDAYALAKGKVQRERESLAGSPSCIDCYSAAEKSQVHVRLGELLCAHLRATEERVRTRHSGRTVKLEGGVTRLLKKSHTTYYGIPAKKKAPL